MARGWGREEDFDSDKEQTPASPAPRSPYITREGYEHLRAEYDQLWHVRRPEVVRALAVAAAEGDRSENAEYIYRKKELREIDRRVRYLQQRLPALKIVGGPPPDRSRIFFGAWVDVVDEQGLTRSYRIVGADEAGAAKSCISVDAPLARNLLGKRAGETVELRLPGGQQEFLVAAVRYGEREP